MVALFYLSFTWLAIEFWFIFSKKVNQSFLRAKIAMFSWFTVNILSFLLETKNKYAADYIFPFDNDGLANYDYAEIFIYILLPVLIWYLFKPKTILLSPYRNLLNDNQVEIPKKAKYDLIDLSKQIKKYLIVFAKYIILPICLIASVYFGCEHSRLIEAEKKNLKRINLASIVRSNYKTLNLKLYLWKSIDLRTKFDDELKFEIKILFDTFDKSKEKYVLHKISQINVLLQDKSGFNISNIGILTSSMIEIEDDFGAKIGYEYQGELSGMYLSDYERIFDWDLTYQTNPNIELVESLNMIDLIGKTYIDAKYHIESIGLQIGTILNPDELVDYNEAFIINQDPKSSYKIPIAGVVNLTISNTNPVSIESVSTTENTENGVNIENRSNDTNEYFTLGSRRDEVLSIQGTPDKIRTFGSTEYFKYGNNEVKLKDSVVVDYDNSSYSVKLKIKIIPKLVSKTNYFTLGSTRDEVLSIQGTPHKIRTFGSTEYFIYGNNEVKFKDGVVIDYDNSSYSVKLKIKL